MSAVVLGGCALERTQAIEKSMEPTILSGEIVHVDRDAYDRAPPQVGDIVEVRAPEGVEEERCGVRPRHRAVCPRPTPGLGDVYVIKRVVALPGERVAIGRRGEAIINGYERDLGPIVPCSSVESSQCERPVAVRIPPGHYFVLGDNRPYSSDSRHWGPVPRRAITGRVRPPDPARR